MDELLAYVHQAARQGVPAHEVEYALWTRVLALGRQALGLFFGLQGSGDLGDAVELPDGQTVRRLEQTHARDDRSVFGDFTLHRTAYGSREGQKIDFVPLDARRQRPPATTPTCGNKGIRPSPTLHASPGGDLGHDGLVWHRARKAI